MIKTTVTPADTDLHIVLPADYVGKKLEVILYSIEEVEGQDTTKKNKKSHLNMQALFPETKQRKCFII